MASGEKEENLLPRKLNQLKLHKSSHLSIYCCVPCLFSTNRSRGQGLSVRTFTMQHLIIVSTLLLSHAAAVSDSEHGKKTTAWQYERGMTQADCKCFPGDACWPSQDEWSALNTTVSGRLITTVPLGSPCHDPYYNEEECAYLRSQWLHEEIQ